MYLCKTSWHASHKFYNFKDFLFFFIFWLRYQAFLVDGKNYFYFSFFLSNSTPFMAVGAGLVVVLHACREDTYSEVNPIRQESRVLNRTRFDVSFFPCSVPQLILTIICFTFSVKSFIFSVKRDSISLEHLIF